MLVTDAKGRKLEIRRLTFIEEMDLARALAGNDDGLEWWKTTRQICSVREIDGEMVHFPDAQIQVDALAIELGDEGMAMAELIDATWQFEQTDPPVVLETAMVTRMEAYRIQRIGGRAADVNVWKNIASLAVWVRSINGVPCAMPTDAKSLRAAVKRLDAPGMMLAMSAEQKKAQDEADNEPPPDQKAADLETEAKN